MKYKIVQSSQFKKDFKKLNNGDKDLTFNILLKLANGEILDPKFRDHKLNGKLKDFRECHVKPDLLLVYSKSDELLILEALRIASHSEVF